MTAAVVLAAGASIRMGRPKQLLAYRGRGLLRAVVETAIEAACDPVMVVLGARARLVGAELIGTAAQPVVHRRWADGVASSIRAGLRALRRVRPNAEAVVLLVADQPLLEPEVIERLIAAHRESGRPIAACAYAGTLGVPALFHSSLFDELARLEGDQGAKGVILQDPNRVAPVSWDGGAVDLDTREDYERLIGG